VSHNTVIHRVARPLVRPLVGTFVRPNHLTTLRLVSGLGAAALFAAGEAWWAWGGVVFLVSAVLDRADGELARQGKLSSPSGHRYDLLADCLCNVAVFLGIGVGVSGGALGLWSIPLGLVAGLAVVSTFAVMTRVERIGGQGAAAFPTTGSFDPDDAILVLAPGAFFDALLPLLVAAAVGAPLFLAWACWRFRDYLFPAALPRKAGS
jgi:archaetidylinositol phosphate synthase